MGPRGKTVAAMSAAALALSVGATTAAADPPAIQLIPLTGNASFTDDVRISLHNKPAGYGTKVLTLSDPSGIVTAELRVQPGAMFPWHTHPGPVVVTVAEGELTYVRADDCRPRRYDTDSAFVDPGDLVHTAVNTGDVETVLYATFLDVAPGEPLSTPAAAPEGCEVDRS